MANRRIIIIGAGCVGVCTAHFLMEKGAPPESITLIDKDLPAGGTSSRGAGIVSYQLWNPVDVSLVEHSMAFFKKMEAESGGAFKLTTHGMLRLAFTPEHAKHFRAYAGFLATVGLPGYYFEKKAAEEMAPALNLDGLAGAVYTPDDFYADPAEFTDGLFTLCRKRGMEYLVMAAVRGLVFDGSSTETRDPREERQAIRDKGQGIRDEIRSPRTEPRTPDPESRPPRIVGVRTDKGEIEADIVIMATGAWTKKLLADAGIPVPLKPYRTQACVVHLSAPSQIPIVHDVTRGIYFRPETGNNVLVGDGTELRESDPDNFKLESDYEFQRSAVERLAEVYPAAKEGELLSGWAGVCTATPDRVPLLGEHPMARGLYLATGMNGFGFMRSPGIGECVANMVLGELPVFDLASYQVERFYRAGRTPPTDFDIREGFTPG